MATSHDYTDGLAAFIQASPSSYHAAAAAAQLLEEAGFQRLDEGAAWPHEEGTARRYVIRDGAIIAWIQPENSRATTPVRILGAHTDSPGFKLKPQPSTTSVGWWQAGVEVYGGPLLSSWLDREIEFAGRLVGRDGREHLVRTGPYARIPQLAIHLDREANTGLALDRQRHTAPVLGVGTAEDLDIVGDLAALAGLSASDVAGYDILTADTQEPRRFGRTGELFAAGRMDNLTSVYAGVHALAQAEGTAEVIPVLAAFDHEELGSETRSGASGPFLADVLDRIRGGLGATSEESARALDASWCLSADAGHSVHPNYADKHDPVNQPLAGSGVLLKINANQRYATDAHGAALVAALSAAAGAPVQDFVSNNRVPCGSTIGPLTATRLGIRTVDIGIPLLSMHSARELCHVDDAAGLAALTAAFFAGVSPTAS